MESQSVAAAGYVVGLPDKTVLNRPVYGWTGRVHVLNQRLRIVSDVVTIAHGKIREVAFGR
jgi:hypothetical protein